MRLTNTDRRGIVDRAVAARFDKQFDALAKDKEVLAVKLYNAAYPKKVRDWAAAAPNGWIRADACLRFNLCGLQIKLNVEHGLPVPHNNGYCGQHRITVADERLRDAFLALQEREAETVKACDQARASLGALLDRLTTLAKVKEVWPEGAAFYDALSPRERVEVPALQVADINALLGLAPA